SLAADDVAGHVALADLVVAEAAHALGAAREEACRRRKLAEFPGPHRAGLEPSDPALGLPEGADPLALGLESHVGRVGEHLTGCHAHVVAEPPALGGIHRIVGAETTPAGVGREEVGFTVIESHGEVLATEDQCDRLLPSRPQARPRRSDPQRALPAVPG